MSGIRYVEKELVLLVHEHVVLQFAQTQDPVFPPGVFSEGLLESAIARQHVGYHEILKYNNAFSNAATLMYGICNDHPFHNGNKRTALMCGIMHLDLNGYWLHEVSQDDLYKLMLRIADHNLPSTRIAKKIGEIAMDPDQEVRAIEVWLRKNSRAIWRGERQITCRELYRILKRFGFELGEKVHNQVEVLRRTRGLFGNTKLRKICNVPAPGDGIPVAVSEIKRIRRILDLDEEHGVDSGIFYDTQSVLDSFMLENTRAIKKLAKT